MLDGVIERRPADDGKSLRLAWKYSVVESVARNAPCPCVSGKKYKLCCLPTESGPDHGGAAEFADHKLRSSAFARLVEFGSKARFRAALQTGLQALWSPAFTLRPSHEQQLAYARPEAEIGMPSYLMLDAPALFGTTIVEQFLAERASHVSRAEHEYLHRLSSTRMSLYRIDDVRLGEGLTCLELWRNERIGIREVRLTHDVIAGSVVAARAFGLIDGTTVFDGAVYLFTQAQALELVVWLRAEWKSARTVDPAVLEQQFLKQRFPTAIHRFWFDRVFEFAEWSSSEYLEKSDGTVTRVGRRDHHFAGSAQSDALPWRLAEFLHSQAAPTAMSIDRLHGFLCAVSCCPQPLFPSAWLPLIWGDQEPTFDSTAVAQRIHGDILEFANGVADAIAGRTFEPLLPLRAENETSNIAEQWCCGFVEGMTLAQHSWTKLVEDQAVSVLITQIFALAASDGDESVAEAHTLSIDERIALLPTVVRNIADYSRNLPQVRKVRAATKPTRSRSDAPVGTTADAATSGHRLKITLVGVRPPVWRRIEIPSGMKLPVVSRVLITSMGWTDTHLHAFRIGAESYGIPDRDFPDDMHNERSVTLADIAPRVKGSFFFDYDFGDGWVHSVVVEAIETTAETNAPRCIAGARACPPEDCGGTSGYADLIRSLRDSTDEEHAAMREWAGSTFAPELFDLEGVNRDLRRLVRKRKPR